MFLTEEYTFDDISLVPRKSDIYSTSKEVDIRTRVGNEYLELPVISAAMTTVTGVTMQQHMKKAGGLGVHYRYLNSTFTNQEKLEIYALRALTGPLAVSPSMGREFITDLIFELMGNYKKFRQELIFVIDVAHGHRQEVLDFANFLKKADVCVWSGNIATAEAALDYSDILDWSTDAIKVGIGPGSACSTRVVAGVGRPQASALFDIYSTLKISGRNISIISDGGIKASGDIVKALALGADAVMVGGLLAGTTEAEGPVLPDHVTHEKYKVYEGMASESALEKAGKKVRVEGVAGRVPWIGPVEPVLEQFKDGIQTGLSYMGARNIDELRRKAVFVRQTHAGYIEGTPRI